MTKRFEPSRDREVLIALDVQTSDGPAWEPRPRPTTRSSRCTSWRRPIARALARRRVAFGLTAAGYTGAETRIAQVPVSSAPGQAERVLDLLARLSSHASMPFERLLASRRARTVRPGSTVLVLTARDPRPFAAGPPPPRAARRATSSSSRVAGMRPRRRRAPGGRVRRPPGGDGRALAGRRAAGDRAVSAAIVLLPTILAVLAEAAWVSVLASLLQAFTLHPPAFGYAWFLAATVLGLLAARILPPRLGDRWPIAAAGLAIACAAVAWLWSAEVRAIVAAQGLGGLGDAIAANLGAWLIAVAFVRGIPHARLPEDPNRIANLLGLAIPGLAVVAMIGGMVGEPYRGTFLAGAQAEVLLFLVAGILALSLSRLGLIATGAAVDWRRNPAWLALLVVLLLATAGVAIAASLYAGPPIVVALGALFTPLLIIGFFVGFDRRSVAILALSILGTAAVASLLQLFATNNPTPPPLPPGAAFPPEPDVAAATPVTIGVLGIVLAVAVIALLVLARLWLRRPRDEEPLVPETREIDRGDWEPERRWARPTRPVPATARAP